MSIKMDEIHKKHKSLSEGEIILDVRTPEEFAEGHVEGAVNIPYDELEGRSDELKTYKHIYIYCRSGRRAQIANEFLANAGMTNVFCVDDGGMIDWNEKGYETVKK